MESIYFREGYQARADWKAPSDNPYKVGTYAHLEWEQGYATSFEAGN